jgi:hypothetical protein
MASLESSPCRCSPGDCRALASRRIPTLLVPSESQGRDRRNGLLRRPDDPTHRFLVYDDDSIFSNAVTHAIKTFEIEPKRTTFRSPWQNGTAERFVGSIRRELLDHVVVLNEDHLRRLLREYADYYNDERVHTSIGDSPNGRTVESRLSKHAKVVGLPLVGGLHHRYRWREAA